MAVREGQPCVRVDIFFCFENLKGNCGKREGSFAIKLTHESKLGPTLTDCLTFDGPAPVASEEIVVKNVGTSELYY